MTCRGMEAVHMLQGRESQVQGVLLAKWEAITYHWCGRYCRCVLCLLIPLCSFHTFSHIFIFWYLLCDDHVARLQNTLQCSSRKVDNTTAGHHAETPLCVVHHQASRNSDITIMSCATYRTESKSYCSRHGPEQQQCCSFDVQGLTTMVSPSTGTTEDTGASHPPLLLLFCSYVSYPSHSCFTGNTCT